MEAEAEPAAPPTGMELEPATGATGLLMLEVMAAEVMAAAGTELVASPIAGAEVEQAPHWVTVSVQVSVTVSVAMVTSSVTTSTVLVTSSVL